jgi:hypothetical protein
MNLLTTSPASAMLYPLSQKTEAGISTPEDQGHKRPLSNVVFLCPSKTATALRRAHSVMAGCVGRPLKRSAGSWAGSANLIQSVTQRLAPKGGGLSPYPGALAMRHNYAQNSAISSRFAPRQSLFNLVKRTTQGNRLVCADLTFAQVSGLLSEFPNSFVVKFSKMETRHGN